jgi:hypothetical protein
LLLQFAFDFHLRVEQGPSPPELHCVSIPIMWNAHKKQIYIYIYREREREREKSDQEFPRIGSRIGNWLLMNMKDIFSVIKMF